MGEDDSPNPHGYSTTTSSFPSQPTIAELSAQIAQLIKMQTQTSNPILNQDPNQTTPNSTQMTTQNSNQTLTSNPNQMTIPTTITYEASAAQIGIKLDGTNYALWSQVVEMHISGKDKLGYINGDLPQPPPTAPTFPRWRTENSIVKGWLINSLEQSLIGNFIRFPTAKAVWDAIATTYYDGTDTSQVYDLKRRVSRMRQAGGSIETYYNTLQSLWREIDFRRPNMMEYESDIKRYNDILQEDRVYIFLDGLDDRLDKARSDVLHMTPFPTVDQAYAYVRREDVRQAVMMNSTAPNGAGLAAKSTTLSGPPTRTRQPQNSSTAAHLQIQSYATTASAPPPKTIPPSRPKAPTDGSGCTHCGNPKHTRDTCFKLHGYPDWWEDLRARKLRETASSSGRAALVSIEPELALFPQVDLTDSSAPPADSGNCGYVFHTFDLRDTTGWIIDSGATDHMTFDPNDFLHTTTPRRTSIANANGVTYPVTGAGTVTLSPSLSLSNTLLVPSLSNKLMSVSQATEQLNCCALIYPNFCLLQDILTKEIIGRGTKRGGLYYVDDFSLGRANSVKHPSDDKHRQIWLWHRRLGHPSFGYMRHLLPELFSVFKDSDFKCDTCILAKSHRASYPLSMNKSTVPFALIHSDVWGPSPISTHSGIRWFVTFVDDCTRMTWLYLMKNKNEVFSLFQLFHKRMETQFNARIQILRSDNGGEFVNHDFQTYFQTHGIIHETTCPQTPQQNGVAERKNRHLLETARALLIGGHVPRHHWDDAVVTAVHLINRMPSGVLNFKTPLQVLAQHGPLPSVLVLTPRIFGCVAFVHLHKNQRSKLDPCALRCIFLGYATHQKGYRCYHPPTQRTYVTLDVTFLESEMFFHDPASNSTLQGEM